MLENTDTHVNILHEHTLRWLLLTGTFFAILGLLSLCRY